MTKSQAFQKLKDIQREATESAQEWADAHNERISHAMILGGFVSGTEHLIGEIYREIEAKR